MSPIAESLAKPRASYEALGTLIEAYPSEKRERPGACGVWSPKAVLAHLSGWLVEAQRRYHLFDAGVRGNQRYDAQSVSARAAWTWEQTCAGLHARLHTLIAHAEGIAPETVARDPRYQEWLDGLASDCIVHTKQLREFREA
jgi:hypothetical protein